MADPAVTTRVGRVVTGVEEGVGTTMSQGVGGPPGRERTFSRIGIINRGEAAMRLIHSVRDLNAEGGDQLRCVAFYTDAERSAMFVRESDEAYPLGPASARPYLDLAVLERALVTSGVDAVWVGWGFVAEDPSFVDQIGRAHV